jgi:hypothetical protein
LGRSCSGTRDDRACGCSTPEGRRSPAQGKWGKGGGHADVKGQDDSPHALTDIGQVRHEARAALACLKVLLDARGVAGTEAVADVRTEHGGDRFAVRILRGDDVLLKIRVAQAFACAHEQCRDAIRGETEELGDLRRFEVLDLRIPENCAPALRQRSEGLGDDRGLERGHHRVDVALTGLVEELRLRGQLVSE